MLTNLEKAGVDESGHPVFVRAARKLVRAQLALGLGGPAANPTAASPAASLVLDELRTMKLDELTPMQALQVLHRWKGGGL